MCSAAFVPIYCIQAQNAKGLNVKPDTTSRRLIELKNFGMNPGALRCWLYLPDVLAPKTPLVVAMHGCTQNAGSYDQGSGWSELAERNGFAVLFPEQQRANNSNLCFNWFEPADIERDAGEALSVFEMVAHVVEAYGINSERVFITGLSAGGAMANVMLAAYPELFAGGAIIGGLPYGVTSNVSQAFERMRGQNPPNEVQLRSALLSGSSHRGSWPRISIWHGTHDQTVRVVNADQIAKQWGTVHETSDAPDLIESINRHRRQTWLDGSGKEAIDLYTIQSMGHGIPLSFGARVPVGKPGSFMLEAGISSTARIALTWGLADESDVAEAEAECVPGFEPEARLPSIEGIVAKAMAHAKPGSAKSAAGLSEQGVSKVINEALRAAGLLR